MKYIILFIILLFTLPSMSQNWINDETFEDTINPRGGFNDDIQEIVIVEFWGSAWF